MSPAIRDFLAYVVVTGWFRPGAHGTTFNAAHDYMEIDKTHKVGADNIGPYRLKAGVEVDNDLTRMSAVLREEGFTTVMRFGRRAKHLRFIRPGDSCNVVLMVFRTVTAYRSDDFASGVLARSPDELRAALRPVS